MYRYFAITVVLLLLSAAVIQAQESEAKSKEFPKASFGLKGGINLSMFSASVNSESRAKPGLAVGMYLKKQIGPKLTK